MKQIAFWLYNWQMFSTKLLHIKNTPSLKNNHNGLTAKLCPKFDVIKFIKLAN